MKTRFLLFGLLLGLMSACTQPTAPPVAAPASPTAAQPSTAAPPPTATVPPPVETSAPAGLPGVQETVTPYYLLYLHFFDANIGWALDRAYLMRTEDGGQTWINVLPGEQTPGVASQAYFLDADHAWLFIGSEVGSEGDLLWTADGGQTWQTVSLSFHPIRMQFLSPTEGYILSSLGVGAGSMAVALYHTTDGGLTWEQIFTNDPNLLDASDDVPLSGIKDGMTFRDAQTGWITGTVYADGEPYFYRTDDGGRTWEPQPLPLPEAFSQSQVLLEQPQFFNEQEGLMAATLLGEVNARVVYRTTDGGETWEVGFPLNAQGQVAFASPQKAYLWEEVSTFYVTADSGQTWDRLQTEIPHTESDQPFWLIFADEQHGWAVVMNVETGQERLFRTRDGGFTWEQLWP